MAIVKSGKVVIVLAGRHAGKKAVVVKTYDDGTEDKRYSHCLVAGIARGPRRVTRGMSKKKVEKRSRTVKPFVKYVNVRHVFPTRYVVDMDLKKAVDEADLANAERKVDVKKGLKKVFEDRYLNQKSVTSEKKAAGSTYFFQGSGSRRPPCEDRSQTKASDEEKNIKGSALICRIQVIRGTSVSSPRPQGAGRWRGDARKPRRGSGLWGRRDEKSAHRTKQ
eukprot:CAMPEP_0183306646 /NCGR_PEP_ID=MMETSP0160_2-20130417/13502_1 /TAXON_ID=2839 ORGANISM="Odontella Sinensis, Strain Grunow 1884" /NCGR_SAMPLE_ID=MMETSP0160_2 /ASSEMBLY_ACC=CAM_ASM_000250 /LENGTH=220 /DNA_ID=CAMNT_0025470079 /DNA_START=149 /DNA_END=812 /DNA_ORIENTATION=+